MWRTKGSPCPFRIEVTRTGERKKRDIISKRKSSNETPLWECCSTFPACSFPSDNEINVTSVVDNITISGGVCQDNVTCLRQRSCRKPQTECRGVHLSLRALIATQQVQLSKATEPRPLHGMVESRQKWSNVSGRPRFHLYLQISGCFAIAETPSRRSLLFL